MSYYIVRMQFNRRARRVYGKSGLTLEQAQRHCSDPKTRARGRCDTCDFVASPANIEDRCPRCDTPLTHSWFDAYEEA